VRKHAHSESAFGIRLGAVADLEFVYLCAGRRLANGDCLCLWWCVGALGYKGPTLPMCSKEGGWGECTFLCASVSTCQKSVCVGCVCVSVPVCALCSTGSAVDCYAKGGLVLRGQAVAQRAACVEGPLQ